MFNILLCNKKDYYDLLFKIMRFEFLKLWEELFLYFLYY